MQDLSAEIDSLRDEGVDARVAERALALESGRVFPLRLQILLLIVAGITALVSGTALLVRERMDDIGPVALLAALLLAAAPCYVFGLRGRAIGTPLARQYVLLLGALLLSSAVAFAEVQFRLLGGAWSRHLLLLAVVHGATAHYARSPLVLGLALAAFAGWLGVETRLGPWWDLRLPGIAAAWRCFACAAVFIALRFAFARLPGAARLAPVYEHYAANLAFLGALALAFSPPTRWPGAALLLALAAAAAAIGVRRRRESFVVYATGYATVGLLTLEASVLGFGMLASAVGLATIAAAIVVTMRLRGRMAEAGA